MSDSAVNVDRGCWFPAQLDALTPSGMQKSTLFWLYVLNESDFLDGLSLEPVGSRIVLEMFIALNADESPYLVTRPNWTAEGAGAPFTLAEEQRRLPTGA